MTAATATRPETRAIDRRKVALWEVGAFFAINLGAGLLHFVFELSGFAEPAAVFGSVNESAFEHLKIYFWPAVAFALVQHAYARHEVNNFWWAKGLAIITTPIVLLVAFYAYLGVMLPITGKGFLAADIGSGALGVLAGNVVAYRVLTSHDRGRTHRAAGIGLILVYMLAVSTSAWVQPRVFLYEDFNRYTYTGQFGILDDYTDYLVFTDG